MDTKNSLYEGLTNEIRSERFGLQFQTLKEKYVEFLNYHTPEQLIGTLRMKESKDYYEKDRILHALIRSVQSRSEIQGAAITLLLVALWPALDHVYYRLLPLSKHFTDLFSEIYWAFIEEVERFGLAKCSKIAANLRWDTEKRVRRAPKIEELYQHFIQAYSILDVDPGNSPVCLIHGDQYHPLNLLSEEKKERIQTLLRRIPDPLPSNVFDESERTTAKRIISTLRVRKIISQDEEELLIGHVIEQYDLCEIAQKLGMKAGTARVKYFRAKEKLRYHLQDKKPAVTFQSGEAFIVERR